jgi:hypothetical protein
VTWLNEDNWSAEVRRQLKSPAKSHEQIIGPNASAILADAVHATRL